MSTKSLSMLVRLINTCGRLLVCEVAILSCMGLCYLVDHQLSFPQAGLGSECATYFFPGHAQLDIIHSYVYVMPDNLTHLVWSVRMRRDSGNQRPISPSKLLSVSQVPRSWNFPCVDGIPNDHVQAFLCGSCTEAPSNHEINQHGQCYEEHTFSSEEDVGLTWCIQNQESIEHSSP